MLRTLTWAVLALALSVPAPAISQTRGVEILRPGETAGNVTYVDSGPQHMLVQVGAAQLRVDVPDGWAVTQSLLILRGVPAPRIENTATEADAVIAVTPLPPGVTMQMLREQLTQQNADEAFRQLGSPIAAVESAENLPEGVLLIGRDAGGRTTRQVFKVVGDYMAAAGNQGDLDGRASEAEMREAVLTAARAISILP